MDSMSKYEKEQFKANKKVVFARKFNTLIEKHDGEENYESFAELLGVDRSTFYNWKFGKVLPGKERRKKIALILGAPEDYFERTDLQDDELISQRHHIKMNMEYALYGDQIGINDNQDHHMLSSFKIGIRKAPALVNRCLPPFLTA